MKLRNILQIGAGLLMAGGLGACQNSFDEPGLSVPKAEMVPNTTIAEFKSIFADENTQQCPYKDEASKTPYIIKGRVVSSDATGNIYQTLYIQDETAAMTFAVRRAGLYEYYHLGQEIVVNLTDLWVGKYNYLMQIGWLGESSLGVPQMSRVDFNVFRTHVELDGNPNINVAYVTPEEEKPSDEMYCIIENIDQLPTSPGEDFYNLQGQLVEFRNASFEGGGELTYSEYQSSGVSRYLTQEGNSLKLTVRTSGYATFYDDVLPAGTGTVRGILSYYASDPGYATTDGSINGWQLLLRSVEDCIFDEKGTKEDPYTIEEAQALVSENRTGWVSGYIVGSVMAGVNEVTSNDQIIWGDEAEMTNNLVIAPSADCVDYTECMTVNLPQGTAIRSYANLMDNPTVYKKSIVVRGLITTFLGVPGVSGSGEADTFVIDGVELNPDEPGKPDTPTGGNGTKESPYSVAQVLASTTDADDVWVEGYVVGYVADMAWSSSAVFGNQPTEGSTNYTNGTNLILSDYPVGTAGLDNSIPAGIAAGATRDVLAISKNPSIYGQKVKIKGQMTKYFGMRGLKQVNDYELMGGTTPDKPDTPGVGSGDGSQSNPFNVAAVLASTTDSSDVWVEGYVVGYVADMTWSTSAVFGNQPTEGSNNYTNGTNLILSDYPAGSANLDNSIPVGIAAGAARDVLAISKNPSIYGQKVKIKGQVTKYFGMRGMKQVSEYELLGGTTPDKPDTPSVGGSGDGTESSPYNVAAVQSSTADANDVWVEGYVVGYVADMTWATSAVFGNQATEGSNNYTNGTNLILSDQPVGSANLDNSIPVGIAAGAARDVLAISKNPDIYGKKVRVKGTMTKYFGVRAMKQVSEYKIL